MIAAQVKRKSDYSTRITKRVHRRASAGERAEAERGGGAVLISSKGRYALRLMIYIAAFGDEEGKIALREVAERESISLKYLEQVVRPLVQAGYLKSVRGKGGGYMLAAPADQIRAGDILRTAEGTTAPVACEGLEGSCTRADLCSTVRFWTGLDAVIEEYVDGVTLADLARVPEVDLSQGVSAGA